MALANLTLNLVTNAAAAKQGVQEWRGEAKAAVGDTGAAVDDFRARLMRASDDLAFAAQHMGREFEAANDAMVRDTQRTGDAVDALVDKTAQVEFTSMQERIASAFGVSVGAGFAAAQTWIEKTEEWIKTKLLVIGIGLAVGVTAGVALAVYTAYQALTGSISFIKGLFTGDAYKSENIDALIAVNKEVAELQGKLFITAQHASALRDALSRLGVDKNDYVSVFNDGYSAMRKNGDELDRLGIKYKDAGGKFLETEEFLRNVKKALDEYTEGYDRNAAAASIGAGSYKQIDEALKVTRDEIIASKARLDEYGLAIGPQTQAYIEQYNKAVREFQHESELMSQGFKRAIADNVMPILTDLAVFFKDGFPIAVRVFRYTMAEITTLFYGLRTSVYMVSEGILGSIEAVGFGVAGIAVAISQALRGNFDGAKDAFIAGWEGAKARFAQIGDNIVTQALRNRDAIIQAWGLDDRNELDLGTTRKQGKTWEPKPAPKTPEPEKKSPYQSFIEELDRMIKKVEESEYASMRLKAQQLAEKEGVKDLTAAYDKINQLQRLDSQRVADEMTRRWKLENDEISFQTALIGATVDAQEKLIFARQKYLEVENAIAAAKRAGRPLDQAAIDQMNREADAAIAVRSESIDARIAKQRDPETGFNKAIQEYLDAARNLGEQIKGAITNGLRGAEDALVRFVRTGKLSFHDLADSVLNDLARLAIRQNITAPLANMLTFSGFKNLLGFADGGDPPVGVPSWVGERGPELFVPKSAGTIIPNHALAAAAPTPVVIQNYMTVGDVASMAQVERQLRASEQRTVAAFDRARRYGSRG